MNLKTQEVRYREVLEGGGGVGIAEGKSGKWKAWKTLKKKICYCGVGRF